jgi:hypothetical protein
VDASDTTPFAAIFGAADTTMPGAGQPEGEKPSVLKQIAEARETGVQNTISEKIKRQIKYVEENIGANLLNLNEAAYAAAVAGRDDLVDFIHRHEREYVDYVRQNCEGYATSEVIKEFGCPEEPEKPSVLGKIAEAREQQRRTKTEGRKKNAPGKKKQPRGKGEEL